LDIGTRQLDCLTESPCAFVGSTRPCEKPRQQREKVRRLHLRAGGAVRRHAGANLPDTLITPPGSSLVHRAWEDRVRAGARSLAARRLAWSFPGRTV